MAEANERAIKQRLKHFQFALESDKIDNNSFIEWAIDKLGSFQPKHIGSEALLVAYFEDNEDNLIAFNKLLNCGADYTLKNHEGLTVLHSIVVSISDSHYGNVSYGANNLALSSLKDPFITAILTFHVKSRQTANPCDPNGLSHFHVACMANHVEAVRFFLDNGVSIHEAVNLTKFPLFASYTPLHLAVNYLSFEVLEILLEQRARINSNEPRGITLLHLLLERNLQANKISKTLSLLPQERELSKKILKLLLANTIMADQDAMIIDDSGLSYLHVASAMMDVFDVEQVMHKFKNINKCINMESPLWPGYTALHFAAVFNLDIVKLLVKQGADLEAKDAQGVTPLDLCLERYKITDIHDILSLVPMLKHIKFSDGQTKLLDFISAMQSHDLFKKFLERPSMKVIMFLPNNSLWPGFTPLHLLILLAKSTGNLYNRNSQRVHKTYIQMISDLYVKNTEIIRVQEIHGYTPLHFCFRLGKMCNVRNLLIKLHLEDKNLIDYVDQDNLSFIHIACAHPRNINFFKKLLSNNSLFRYFYNVNRVYKGKSMEKLIIHGWTPLDIAINSMENDRFAKYRDQLGEMIKTLLDYGANAIVKKVYDVLDTHFLVITNFDAHSNEIQVNNEVVHNILLSLVQLTTDGDCFNRIARYCGEAESLKKLVDHGTDVIGIIDSLPRMYYDLLDHKYVINLQLHIAKSCRYKPFYFFMQRGANILATNCVDEDLLIKILLGNEWFLQIMQKIPDLKIQLKTGALTILHVACAKGNTSLVETLLNNGADVNAKVSSDSPIWPGYTLLHICMHYQHKSDSKNILKLLLERKADVTLTDAKQRTPLHMAYRSYLITNLYFEVANESNVELVTMLLKAQKDFRINPMSSEGITHFHIACSMADAIAVENFLKYGNVDIDQPIDFSFSNYHSKNVPGAGCTPIHLAVLKKNDSEKFVEFTSQLLTVDLLLKHGANVNAENALGNTPFHIADGFQLRERLVRSGADVNLKNAIGHTPLEDMLLEGPKSSDQIEQFLRCGSPYNEFNPHTKIGLIALTLRSLPLVEMQRLLSMAINNFPNVIKVDESGRTVIHNLVSIHQINASATDYTTLIELLARTGCDVDDQDHLGRTALHVAVEFKNIRAISGLLLAGADINKTNANGQTPFACQFQSCPRCKQPTDAEDEQCEHYKVFKLLALQVKKLQICGLDVHRINQDIVATGFSGFTCVNVNKQFHKELETLKSIEIEPYSLTLHSFMSELDVVADYPTMSQMKRNSINQFFRPREYYRQFREKYSEVAGLLELQYRKAVTRTELLQKGEISLNCLAKISIPKICSRIILRFLKNSELEDLIAAGKNIV